MNYWIEYYKKEYEKSKMEILKILIESVKSNKIIRIYSRWRKWKWKLEDIV